MQVYVWKNDPEMAFKILQEMIEKGIQPDLPVYSSLVNAFRLGRKLYKCWELHRMVLKSKVELDEAYTGVMMKVYAVVFDLITLEP
jgi:pentatricopeptide repeat protein